MRLKINENVGLGEGFSVLYEICCFFMLFVQAVKYELHFLVLLMFP